MLLRNYGATAFALRAACVVGYLACRAETRRAKAGGAERDRTADLVNAIHALSQLSYGPVQNARGNWVSREVALPMRQRA